MKTNRQKNEQHERDALMRVRPKQGKYEFEPLQSIVNKWIRDSLKANEQT